MKKSRFSEHQIIKILKEVEAGRTAKDVCREYGISNATYYYTWKSKFGGMEASDIRRMRDLEYGYGQDNTQPQVFLRPSTHIIYEEFRQFPASFHRRKSDDDTWAQRLCDICSSTLCGLNS